MEEDYDLVDWEEGKIESNWLWTEAENAQTLGIKGANNVGLTLCQRRSRLKGSQLDPQLHVCKALNCTRSRGIRFVKRELDMLRRCVHPNILRYEDFSYGGRSLDGMNARLYTEYCAYGDLDQFRFDVKSGSKRLSVQEGAQVFRQLAQALLYIHHGISLVERTLALAVTVQTEAFDSSKVQDGDWHTILHRDIKPSNIFVAQRTRTSIQVKLGDFGLARLDTDESFTYVGTTNWLAPEQRHSNDNPNSKRRTTLRSDIYSLGLTMSAVLPQMDSAQQEPSAMAHRDKEIRQLVNQCLHQQDTMRPSSVEILDHLNDLESKASAGLVLDHVQSHLGHETTCRLCRRLQDVYKIYIVPSWSCSTVLTAKPPCTFDWQAADIYTLPTRETPSRSTVLDPKPPGTARDHILDSIRSNAGIHQKYVVHDKRRLGEPFSWDRKEIHAKKQLQSPVKKSVVKPLVKPMKDDDMREMTEALHALIKQNEAVENEAAEEAAKAAKDAEAVKVELEKKQNS